MTRASDTARLVSGGAVINEASNDVDLRVESNGNTAALFVDGGNNTVVCGANAPSGRFDANLEVTAHGGSHRGGIINNNFQAGATDAVFEFNKSRNDTLNSHTVVQSGDNLGSFIFRGSDGSAFVDAGAISCQVDGTPGSNDMPGRLAFYTTPDGATGGTERMRIGQDGTVTIVNQAGPLTLGRNESSGSVTCIGFNNNATSITSISGQCFRIMGDGDVENSNNSYGSISDIKLKENIVDASSQWDDIKALKVKNFSFKKDKLDKPNMIGVIAQDVEAAGMSGLITERYDNDGGKDLETTSKAVKYSVLYMKAIKALQEAMTRIEALEAEVVKLKG